MTKKAAVTLNTKTARSRLTARREPYWSRVEKGLFLGFRRLPDGAGTWIARRRAEDGRQQYRAIGAVNDDDPNDFDRAKSLAADWGRGVGQGVSHKASTVEAACRAYVSYKATNEGKKATAADAEGRFRRLVYGKPIGAVVLDKLSGPRVRQWHTAQVKAAADADTIRRSKDSANRLERHGGSVEVGKMADLVLWQPALLGVRPAWSSAGPSTRR